MKIIPPHAILITKGQISLLVTNHLWQISFFQSIWNDFKTDLLSAYALVARNILRVKQI